MAKSYGVKTARRGATPTAGTEGRDRLPAERPPTQPLRPYRRRYNEPPPPPAPAWQTVRDFASSLNFYGDHEFNEGRHRHPRSERETQLRRHYIERFIRGHLSLVPLPYLEPGTYLTRHVVAEWYRVREEETVAIIEGMIKIDNDLVTPAPPNSSGANPTQNAPAPAAALRGDDAPHDARADTDIDTADDAAGRGGADTSSSSSDDSSYDSSDDSSLLSFENTILSLHAGRGSDSAASDAESGDELDTFFQYEMYLDKHPNEPWSRRAAAHYHIRMDAAAAEAAEAAATAARAARAAPADATAADAAGRGSASLDDQSAVSSSSSSSISYTTFINRNPNERWASSACAHYTLRRAATAAEAAAAAATAAAAAAATAAAAAAATAAVAAPQLRRSARNHKRQRRS